jgi:hypothetical protein
MSPRYVIAALSVAMIAAGTVPSLAQTPEQSPAAMAAPKAPSESASSTSSATPGPAAAVRGFDVDRSAKDTTSGKAAVVAPTAKAQ